MEVSFKEDRFGGVDLDFIQNATWNAKFRSEIGHTLRRGIFTTTDQTVQKIVRMSNMWTLIT